MSFKEIFAKYWDMAITGFIGGYVVYFMLAWSNITKNKWTLSILMFLIMLLMVFIYSFCIWFFGKKR